MLLLSLSKNDLYSIYSVRSVQYRAWVWVWLGLAFACYAVLAAFIHVPPVVIGLFSFHIFFPLTMLLIDVVFECIFWFVYQLLFHEWDRA